MLRSRRADLVASEGSPLPLSGADAVTYADRYAIVVGGTIGSTTEVYEPELKRKVREYNPIVWVYDVETNLYTELRNRMPHGANDIRATLMGDTVYAVGGENVDKKTSNTMDYLRIGKLVPNERK